MLNEVVHPGSTIAAIATAVAAGAGSVAIVRISGPDAVAIGRRLFRPAGHRQRWESHRVLYGHVLEPTTGQVIDEVLLLLMRAPRSFTGEDVVELHCHGGLMCVQRVLEQVLASGAVAASPGAFSQRAFLNGRLDLTRAEAVAQMVTARSRRAAELALAGLDGGIQRQIEALRQRLLDQLAELEARLDFEEDLPPLDHAALDACFKEVTTSLDRLVADGRHGEALQEGLKVAIVGPPNVGKSSLLNRLGRHDRAIVTPLPGTTRDVLTADLVMQGVPVTLVDTAGIRPSNDPVEQLGIARSRMAMVEADVIVQLFDASVGWTAADQKLAEELPTDIPQLTVGNKVDLFPADHRRTTQPLATGATGTDAVEAAGGTRAGITPAGRGDGNTPLLISAMTGSGMEEFATALLGCCGLTDLDRLEQCLNRRQMSLARSAADALRRLQATQAAGLPWDFWTIDLRAALRCLGEITGAEVNEAVLDRIFSRFCIGK